MPRLVPRSSPRRGTSHVDSKPVWSPDGKQDPVLERQPFSGTVAFTHNEGLGEPTGAGPASAAGAIPAIKPNTISTGNSTVDLLVVE